MNVEARQQPDAFIFTELDANATGALHDAYNHVRCDDGSLDNVMSIHSVNPEVMIAHHSIYTLLCRQESPRFSRIEREIIAVAVSLQNQCQY